jgi:hypothetical protein
MHEERVLDPAPGDDADPKDVSSDTETEHASDEDDWDEEDDEGNENFVD